MELLPDEVLLHIISYLNFKSLENLTKVSTRFNALTYEIIEKKCTNLKWRLDLFFPPEDLPEGVLILNYNQKKRKYLSNHKYKKYRRLSLKSYGISKKILSEYPTTHMKLPFNSEIVVDMMW